MSLNSKPKFVVLVILDGWGIATPGAGNAITLSNTPNINKFLASYPHTQLEAAGQAVGLPRGEDGNTETGHINLGAGSIIYQDLERINMSISDGSFFENKILLSAIENSKKNNSNLHLMGLIGTGGVHSNLNHLYALIHLAALHKFNSLYLHLFTDGRDSPQTSSKAVLAGIQKLLDKEKVGSIASIMGRYWAMDRDQRWDRTEKAYKALTQGTGKIYDNIATAMDDSYSKGITDEFIEPILIKNEEGKINLISKNDSAIFFNFRVDRPRQLTKAFVYKDFASAKSDYDSNPYKKTPTDPSSIKLFERGARIENLFFVTMTEYSRSLVDEGTQVAFPPDTVTMPLSSVISNNNLRQLKVTESEKERFVTFYFNGFREKPFTNEEKVIIPSSKVPTYDQKPEMMAQEITSVLVEKLKNGDYSFALVNYPNADMVGHTGNIGPTVKAVEKVDEQLGILANFALAYEGALLITADHGNAEEMINLKTGEIDTEHSNNNVPFVCVFRPLLNHSQTLKVGILADIAPTVLSLLEVQAPASMTGRDLLKEIKNF